jgi:hypothetical protein
MRFLTIICLICLTSTLWAETIMSPRTKAEHEAELKRLSELYAPSADPKLQAQRAEQIAAEPAAGSTTEVSPAPQAPLTKAAIGQGQTPAAQAKVRAELLASGLDKFIFAGKVYDRATLLQVLQELGGQYQLDHLVLLQGGEKIQLNHLVELSKLSDSLKLPAMYQLGSELRAVN